MKKNGSKAKKLNSHREITYFCGIVGILVLDEGAADHLAVRSLQDIHL